MKEINIDRIIKKYEFRHLSGISRTTEWRWMRRGLLPQAVVIDGRILGYRESSYIKWLEDNSNNAIN